MVKNIFLTFGAILLVAILIVGWLIIKPTIRTFGNNYNSMIQKIDDATLYETKKEVEDTCRAMQASYQADKLTYEQYNGQDGEKQSWADQAKMRANRTAANYNEYILKNDYVWSGNVPNDIMSQLPYLE